MAKAAALACMLAAVLMLMTPAPARSTEAESPVLTREAVIGSLPCFGCHNLKAFLDGTSSGIFSHEKHWDFGKHCNQCHSAREHQMPRVYISTCTLCHSLELTFEGGGMGQVLFSHDLHTKAFLCNDCHMTEFWMKRTGTIKMEPMHSWQYCGLCHDGEDAFSVNDCTRCHKQKVQ